MKQKIIRAICLWAVAVFTFCFLSIAFTGCQWSFAEYTAITDADFLQTDGEWIKNQNGTGEKVYLRGTNASSYLLVEEWMSPFISSAGAWQTDHKKITDTFVSRFGGKRTRELWKEYRENYWTEKDFRNCADMKMNVIRLPFSYMNVDPDYYNCEQIEGQRYNFSQLDWFVNTAAQYGLYTILDLHGAYGSQNGQDHCGEMVENVEDVDFFYNEEKQQKTVDLWQALAAHFADNPAVAAYDLLNEPGEKGANTSKRHWDFYDKAYQAVRKEDTGHIVIIETMYESTDLPQPSAYGWENCMYSVHNYADRSYESIRTLNIRKLKNLESGRFGVPLYMGEFSAFQIEEGWDYLLNLLNERGWHWTSWGYKLNYRTEYDFGGWGIYQSSAATIEYDTEEYESILKKIRSLRKSSEYRFESGTSLQKVMKKGCMGAYPTQD